jgi:hypothetical protein
MISTLVPSISAGPEDVEWPEDGGEVVPGDILERVVDARVLMPFDACVNAVRKSSENKSSTF